MFVVIVGLVLPRTQRYTIDVELTCLLTCVYLLERLLHCCSDDSALSEVVEVLPAFLMFLKQRMSNERAVNFCYVSCSIG